MKQPFCTYCLEPGHYQSFCRRKPQKAIKTNKLPNKIGRVGAQTKLAKEDLL